METQVQTFALTLITGILLGLIFDCYRTIRGIYRTHFLITSITDLIYWIIATIIIFFALLLGNWGEIRFYIFLGLAVGAFIYYKMLSKYIMFGMMTVIYMIKLWVKKLFKLLSMVIRPIIYLSRLVLLPIIYPIKHVKRLLGHDKPIDDMKPRE